MVRQIGDMDHDVAQLRSSARHGDVSAIRKFNGKYYAMIGITYIPLFSKTTEDVQYVLDHIDHTLEIVSFQDEEGVRIGTFYKEGNGSFSLKTSSIMEG